MGKRILILLVVLLNATVSISQSDTLNKTNAKGEKNGYWKIFLDEKLEQVTDTGTALYFAYELYINGDPVIFFPETKAKYKFRIVHSVTHPNDRKIRILNESIHFYSEKDDLIYQDNYVMGLPTISKSFFYLDDHTLYNVEIIDFTRSKPGEKYSYYLEIQDYKIFREVWEVKKYWCLQAGKKIKRERIKE